MVIPQILEESSVEKTEGELEMCDCYYIDPGEVVG